MEKKKTKRKYIPDTERYSVFLAALRALYIPTPVDGFKFDIDDILIRNAAPLREIVETLPAVF